MKALLLAFCFGLLFASSAHACKLAGKWKRMGGNGVAYKYIINDACDNVEVSKEGGPFDSFEMNKVFGGWRFKSNTATLTIGANRSVHVKRKGWLGSGGKLKPVDF